MSRQPMLPRQRMSAARVWFGRAPYRRGSLYRKRAPRISDKSARIVPEDAAYYNRSHGDASSLRSRRVSRRKIADGVASEHDRRQSSREVQDRSVVPVSGSTDLDHPPGLLSS